MKIKLLLIISFLSVITLSAQVQISNFTYDDVGQYPPGYLVEFNNLIYFIGTTDGYGSEIWYTDGTPGNVTLLKDINPGNANGILPQSNFSESYTTLNNELYFIASEGTSNGEIWKTDGTDAGTIKVTDFVDGRTTKLTTVGSTIFFLVTVEERVMQLWKTDGTTSGTSLVKDNIAFWNDVTFEGAFNDTFIFTFQTEGSNYTRVWRSNGTENGTFPITDELYGNGSAGGSTALSQYIKYNNKLYFVSRRHLYVTDGTLENTQIVSELIHGTPNSLVNFGDVIKANNKLYYLYYSFNDYHLSIWEADGTASGTNMVYENYSSHYFFPSNLYFKNNSLLFTDSNSEGETLIKSLDLSDYSTSEAVELDANPEEPFSFFPPKDACNIYEINDSNLFIHAPIGSYFEKISWLYYVDSKTLNRIALLDRVRNPFFYNDNIYYPDMLQLWRYDFNLGTPPLEKATSISLYPNPTSHHINFDTPYQIESLSIVDVNGRLIKEELELENKKIDILDLTAGIYFIQMEIDGRYIIKKIIKN